MKRTLLTAVAASALTATILAFNPDAHLIAGKPKGTPAQKLETAKRNQAHAQGACRSYKRILAGRHPRSHCGALPWLARVHEALLPLGFREYVNLRHPCLARIIDRENPPWHPRLDYGFGYGNVYEAYGIPQAKPGTKMASAGADWETNPWTQLRWMIGYVNGRYGGECGALAFHNRNGWYQVHGPPIVDEWEARFAEAAREVLADGECTPQDLREFLDAIIANWMDEQADA